MILYLSVVFLSVLGIILFNIFCFAPTQTHYELWIIIATIFSTVVEILISGLLAFITERLPDKKFYPDEKIMQVSQKERKFYEKLKIRSWKDKVWELGALGGFRKNKIKDPNNPEYILKFITESGKGMLGHILSIIFSGLVVFVLPLSYAFRIGVPIAIVGIILNLLPTMILRYNIPKLKVAYKRAIILQERANNKDNNNV